MSLEMGLDVTLAISSFTISGFDQHRLKIETVLEIKRSDSGTGILCAQPGGICGQSTASFVTDCLLSNAYLPANVFAASSSGSSLRICKLWRSSNFTARTLHPYRSTEVFY
jgi:hypothetical protein